MEVFSQRNRFVIEVVLLVVSMALLVLNVLNGESPDSYILVGAGCFVVYVLAQFFAKLGLTLPFVFIVFWMIVAIIDWNKYQALNSFKVADYWLAIMAVTNALIGVVVYFENKVRW